MATKASRGAKPRRRTESQLSSWSGVIERVAEKGREDRENRLTQMEQELPSQLRKLKTMPDQELLTFYAEAWYRSGSGYDKREQDCWKQLSDRAEQLLLQRMGG